MHLLFNATSVPSALMFAALNEQDLLCRVFGECLSGDPIDREVGDLIGSSGPLALADKLFTYVRYNADLSPEGLLRSAAATSRPSGYRSSTRSTPSPNFAEIGCAAAAAVKPEHFARFPA